MTPVARPLHVRAAGCEVALPEPIPVRYATLLPTANFQNLSARKRLDDVAYAQVRRKTVKIRANF